jgi:hypothetical protein
MSTRLQQLIENRLAIDLLERHQYVHETPLSQPMFDCIIQQLVLMAHIIGKYFHLALIQTIPVGPTVTAPTLLPRRPHLLTLALPLFHHLLV